MKGAAKSRASSRSASPARTRKSKFENRNSANGHGPMTMAAWGGYDGANFSPGRGFVYFPTLDSKRDLDSYTQFELRKRSRWLYVNSGLARRCIDGIAAMIGSLTPVPLTDDKDWNQLALKSFNNNAGADLIFDVAGKFNFWSAQPMLTALRLLDGDILTVLTESESGIARSMFYEAHQIGNAADQTNQTNRPSGSDWIDGVRVTPQNRPIAYRILNDDGQKSADIPAQDAIFHCNYRRPGRARGEPALCHAINHLLDRSEIFGYLKTAGKNAAQIGYFVERAAGFTGPAQLPAFGVGPSSQTLPDGTTKVMVEEAYRGGKIPVGAPGETIKVLLDDRPHPNQLDFIDKQLVRDIAWGLNASPDILWNIAALGGANTRYVLADAQMCLVEPGQELLADQWCSRQWVYYIAKELKAKRLRPCQDPEWWKHGWQPQQKLTVDIGRDGKLFIDLHKSGMITLKRYHAALGQNWKIETDEHIAERAHIIEQVSNTIIHLPDGTNRPMTMEEAFPPQPGAVNVTEQKQEDPTPSSSAPSAPSAVNSSP